VNKVAQMSARERADVFAETAERKAVAEAIIEKDFWVCWTLRQLFSIEPFAGRLLFKGGTSLSKIFHAINRFSEDIDLAVDYVALGFSGAKDPRRRTCRKQNELPFSTRSADWAVASSLGTFQAFWMAVAFNRLMSSARGAFAPAGKPLSW